MTDTASATLDRRALRSALGLILIGGPIVVVDLRVSTLGGVDLINDALGHLLIFLAVISIRPLAAPPSYTSRMGAVAVLSALIFVWSLAVQFGPAPMLIHLLISGLAVIGILLFCAAMRDLSAFHGFGAARAAWRRASGVCAIFLGGLWLLSVVTRLAQVAPSGPQGVPAIDVGSAAILLLFLGLAIVLIPLISVFVAILTTRGELRPTPPIAPEPA